MARFVRWLERLFARAPRTVVLVLAGPTVSVLAGVSGMRAGGAAAANRPPSQASAAPPPERSR